MGNHTQSIEWYHSQWPWVTFDPHFKVMKFFEDEYRVLKTKLLLRNRKLYLTYGMVLCLVTLTDLWTRRAGLSASAELLVTFMSNHTIVFREIRLKNMTPRVLPFKVIVTDTHRSGTYDFLSTFHSNQAHILLFPIYSNILAEIFPNQPIFDAPQTRFPLEFGNCDYTQKTRLVVLPCQE